ncbi:hypothetical protein S7335_716 [Synechococcus sp. PCC 7335]|uniref:hypothetical protein n=1 Tax=Synechococcus sp. (strain ATCC 29403 / PCC 7335) TaxID=91464 RepID=UPI00017EE4AC|nr:hypothetical protein [Synechococcus sp. PCC 7335]EDX83536.1 hypothetical protein S7335_716 [Synechococcus sp. PCC 7335]
MEAAFDELCVATEQAVEEPGEQAIHEACHRRAQQTNRVVEVIWFWARPPASSFKKLAILQT